MDVLYTGANDNVIELADLTNGMTAALVTGATVTANLLTASGVGVTGATGLTLTAVAGATGTYRATVPYTVTLTTGSTYTARVTVVSGALHGEWNMAALATTRTG